MEPQIIKSTLSHDTQSNRIYLMHLDPDDYPHIVESLEILAQQQHYTKIFVKVPAAFAPSFLNAGYIMEAMIPKMLHGNTDVLFLSLFRDASRREVEHDAMDAFQQMMIHPKFSALIPLNPEYQIRPLHSMDINAMIQVFKAVFASYPFPIFEASFLQKSMEESGTRYFGVFCRNQLVALSSAECDHPAGNAEMTDFAVLPAHRGNQLAIHLLSHMEKVLKADNYRTLFTISRLKSLSMNKTFFRLGYKYSGTLIRNTQISGEIESMNIWYKHL